MEVAKKNIRIEWVDIYKGIAILLVVIGHSASPINNIIYTFHMAAFFFISGYTSKIEEKKVSDVILGKYYSLRLPFFTLFFGFLSILYVLNFFGVYHLLFANDFPGFFKSIDLLFKGTNVINLMGATWFLVTLFLVFIFQKVLIRLCNNKIGLLYILASIVIFGIGYLLIRLGYRSNYWLVDLVMVAQFYFAIGAAFQHYQIFEKIQKSWKVKWAVALCASIGLYYFSYINNSAIDFPSRKFCNPIFNLIVTMCGVYILYIISFIIVKLPFIKQQFILFGKNTLGILFFHFLCFKPFFALLAIVGKVQWQYLQRLVPVENNKYWFFLALFSIYLSIAIWKLILKVPIFSTLLGKNGNLYKRFYFWLVK